MKTNNAMKYLATTLVALAANFVASAGDIWYVGPDNDTYSSEAKAASVGQAVKFSIYLANNMSSTTEGDFKRSWRAVADPGMGSEVLAWETMRPMLAIEVSGRTEYAKLVNTEYVFSSDGSTEEAPNGLLYKMSFEYVPQAGDLALPLKIKLVNNGANKDMCWLNVGKGAWQFMDGNDAVAKAADFHADNQRPIKSRYTTDLNALYPGLSLGSGNQNMDLASSGISWIYIKTVDFDDNSTQVEVGGVKKTFWRTVPATDTSASPMVPTIKIVGGLENTEDSTVYVWVGDSKEYKVAKDTGEAALAAYWAEQGAKISDNQPTLTNDYGQVVAKVIIPAGKSEATFLLEGVTEGKTSKVYLSSNYQNMYASDVVGSVIEGTYLVREVVATKCPQLHVRVTISGDGMTSDHKIKCLTDVSKPVAKVNVHLSQPATENTTVKLHVTAPGTKFGKIADTEKLDLTTYTKYDFTDANHLRELGTSKSAENGQNMSQLTVDFIAGEQDKTIYLYGLAPTAEIYFAPEITLPANAYDVYRPTEEGDIDFISFTECAPEFDVEYLDTHDKDGLAEFKSFIDNKLEKSASETAFPFVLPLKDCYKNRSYFYTKAPTTLTDDEKKDMGRWQIVFDYGTGDADAKQYFETTNFVEHTSSNYGEAEMTVDGLRFYPVLAAPGTYPNFSITVTNPDGLTAKVTASVQVNESAKIFYNITGKDESDAVVPSLDADGYKFYEGDYAVVGATIERTTIFPMYLFIEPLNSVATNILIDTYEREKVWYSPYEMTRDADGNVTIGGKNTSDVEILGGTTASSKKMNLFLRDGLRNAEGGIFRLKLCGSKLWDEDKVKDYMCESFIITVANREPKITSVWQADTYNDIPEGTDSGIMALVDTMTKFSVNVTDVADDLMAKANETENWTNKCMTIIWDVQAKSERFRGYKFISADSEGETSAVDDFEMPFAIPNATAKVTVYVIDKDMRTEGMLVWNDDPSLGSLGSATEVLTGDATYTETMMTVPEGKTTGGWKPSGSFNLANYPHRSFTVQTGERAAVILGAPLGDKISEEDFMKMDDGLPISVMLHLTEGMDAPKKPVVVTVSVYRKTAVPADTDAGSLGESDMDKVAYTDPDLDPDLLVGTYEAVINKRDFDSPVNFYFKDVDGTKGTTGSYKYYFKGEVRTDGGNTQTVCDLFESGEMTLSVVNSAPMFSNYDEQLTVSVISNMVTASKGVEQTFAITVTDVKRDWMESPAEVAVYDVTAGNSEVFKWTYKAEDRFSDNNKLLNEQGDVELIIPVSPASVGVNQYKVVARDKDGEMKSINFYLYVSPSKQLNLAPLGPSSQALSELATRYRAAAGGADNGAAGRVWALTGTLSTNTTDYVNFAQTWTYSTVTRTVEWMARGYRVGDKETKEGMVSGNPDLTTKFPQPVSAKGSYLAKNSTETGYEYANDRDSFLYATLFTKPDKDTGIMNSVVASRNAEVGTGATATGQKLTSALDVLDGENDESKLTGSISYATHYMEAIFSLEYRPADNMGDINQDGIPDSVALGGAGANGEAFYKVAASGGGGEQGQGQSPASGNNSVGDTSTTDLANLANYNDDLDFFPLIYSNGGCKWYADEEHNAKPFSAIYEVRGIHEGLNKKGVSDIDMSEAERVALLMQFAKENPTDFAAYQAASDAEKPGLLKKFWNSTAWTCENPTDPTIEDTDGDKIPDGVEYYIWYYATVGRMDAKGNLVKLTGRRKHWTSFGFSEFIPAEELARAFDPNKAASDDDEDFDRDGLSNLEELVLGTSPIDYDTDNGGVDDYYEIIYDLDPLDINDDVNDKANPDGDFMAYLEEKAPVVVEVVTATNSLYYVFEEMPELTDGDPADYAKVTLLDGTVYFVPGTVADVPVLEENGKIYLATSVNNAYKQVSGVEGDVPGGKAEYLYAGLLLAEAPSDAVGLMKKTVSGEALRVWKYGTDNKWIYVPAPIDGQTKEAVASEVTVVSVATDVPMAYLHFQVYAKVGFDPRTAWNKEVNGVVASRWLKDLDVTANGFEIAEAKNTRPFTTRDEYLLLQYRNNVTDVVKDATVNGKIYGGGVLFRAKLDKPLAELDDFMSPGSIYWGGEWHETVKMAGGTIPRDISVTNTTENVAYSAYGADTDGDGIPDGWELYVNLNPCWSDDALMVAGEAEGDLEKGSANTYLLYDDGDKLTFLEEYAGTDSCNAYTNVPSIMVNHPADEKSLHKGWFNKFWPTDPYNSDTDGDGLADHLEGGKLASSFFVSDVTGRGVPCVMQMIWGDPEDNGSTCIRGGGCNPCSVDTDRDALPDAWEVQFHGLTWKQVRDLYDMSGSGGNQLTADQVYAIQKSYVVNACTTWTNDVPNINELIELAFSNTEKLSTDTRWYSVDGDDVAWKVTDKTILGGMDPTYNGDASYDWDMDGLANYQEYLVQGLRHLRYDDAETPLMGRAYSLEAGGAGSFVGFVPMQIMDGKSFYQICEDAGFTGLITDTNGEFNYRALGYFARPQHEYDPAYHLHQGIVNYAVEGLFVNPDKAGLRYMFPPNGIHALSTAENIVRVGGDAEVGGAGGFYADGEWAFYVSTDPRRFDSDGDGMDDFYELFHGLNPLLGSTSNPLAMSAYAEPNFLYYDRIANHYMGEITSWNNAWTGWGESIAATGPACDAMRYPWMMGAAEADADGDGVRNCDEAIVPNIGKPMTMHTDPTPLWFTDWTDKGIEAGMDNPSFTAQYYQFDPYFQYDWADGTVPDLLQYPWMWKSNVYYSKEAATQDIQSLFMYAFEENEGYDTDHDFISDGDEVTTKVVGGTDPLNFMDPNRRQAMYFEGTSSVLANYGGKFQRVHSTSALLLRKFTVEAWVMPERTSGADQIILERCSQYGGATFKKTADVLRANFRIGITSDGYWFGECEDNEEGGVTMRASTQKIALKAKANTWTHVSLAYDGKELVLRLDGGRANENPEVSVNGGVVPANGVYITTVSPVEVIAEEGYRTVPTCFMIGAGAADVTALTLSADTTANSYKNYFKGYIDEVRVWDGARLGTDIAADYSKRYSFADVLAKRDMVFDQFMNGMTRTGESGVELTPELLQHYNFVQLPGGVDDNAKDALKMPTLFEENVLDNVYSEGISVRDYLKCGWWSQIPMKSQVYNEYSIVPWIANTVQHLPPLTGAAADSFFWGNKYAGYLTPEEAGFNYAHGFNFANSANPYPYINSSFERRMAMFRAKVLHTGDLSPYSTDGKILAEEVARAEYQLRTEFVGTSDLVPLGNAWAKRISNEVGMWDGQGCSDAWEYTGTDQDADGLPDWWVNGIADIKDANGNALYSGTLTDVKYDTVVKRNGVEMQAREAYIRDLAEGLVYNPANLTCDLNYRNNGDADGNHLPDWWEKIYEITGVDMLDDYDRDGLSNFMEYFIGECFSRLGFPAVRPDMFSTFENKGQVIPDYFYPQGKLYLGEMFTDHDMMDDLWEDENGAPDSYQQLYYADRYVYDAHLDWDDDGWSNWAECRVNSKPSKQTSLIIGWEPNNNDVPVQCEMLEHPIPQLQVEVSYNGVYGKGNSGVLNKDIVVQAWSKPQEGGIPDASWRVSSAGSDAKEQSKYKNIGIYSDMTKHYTLSPGSVKQGSVCVKILDKNTSGIATEWVGDVNSMDDRASIYDSAAIYDVADAVDPAHGKIVCLVPGGEKQIGEINYETGDVTINFRELPEKYYVHLIYEGTGDTDRTIVGKTISAIPDVGFTGSSTVFDWVFETRRSWYCLEWVSLVGTSGTTKKLYLSDSDGVDAAIPSMGHLREGMNQVVVFLDVDGDGLYTPGEPYGVANNVEVGYNRGAPVRIELSDTNPSTVRVDLANSLSETDFTAANALTDRGINGSTMANWNAGEWARVGGVTPTRYVHLRVIRSYINGLCEGPEGAKDLHGGFIYTKDMVMEKTERTVWEGDIDLDKNPSFTEANLGAYGMWDLDTANLLADWNDSTAGGGQHAGIAPLTNATYRFFFSWSDSSPHGSSLYVTNASGEETSVSLDAFVHVVEFVNAFEAGNWPSPTTPISQGIFNGGRPVFEWKHECVEHANGKGDSVLIEKDYPAFQVCVWNAEDHSLVYDSGIQPMPPRSAAGVYRWTAPLYVDSITPQGVIFSNTNNYEWAVTMHDAKMCDTAPASVYANEKKNTFRMSTMSTDGLSAYGSIGVRVKYFGPGTTATSGLEKLIRVEAFDSPDFTGVPSGAAYVTSTGYLRDKTENKENALIKGLVAGTYYIRAYIDTNGNAKRDEWESWGYVNYIGDKDATSMYEPRAVEISLNGLQKEVTLYIEDTDIDQDGLPDVWEMENGDSLDEKVPTAGATNFTRVNPKLQELFAEYDVLDFYEAGVSVLLQKLPLVGKIASAVQAPKRSLSAGPTLAAAAQLLNAPYTEESTAITITKYAPNANGEAAFTASVKVVNGESAVSIFVADDVDAERSYTWELMYSSDLKTWEQIDTGSFTAAPSEVKTLLLSKESFEKAKAAKNYSPSIGFFKIQIKE